MSYSDGPIGARFQINLARVDRGGRSDFEAQASGRAVTPSNPREGFPWASRKEPDRTSEKETGKTDKRPRVAKARRMAESVVGAFSHFEICCRKKRCASQCFDLHKKPDGHSAPVDFGLAIASAWPHMLTCTVG